MSDFDVPSPGTTPSGGDPGFDQVIEDVLAGRIESGPEDEMSLVGLVDALRAPGSTEELGDVDAAVSAFAAARAGGTVVTPLAPRRARRAVIAVAVVTGAVLLAGTTAAAATGSLPAPIQDAIHRVIPAVPAHDEPSDGQSADAAGSSSQSGAASDSIAGGRSSLPAGNSNGGAVLPLPTDARGASGLCTAYAANAATTSTAMQRLVAAARAENLSVDSWCAKYAPAVPRKPTGAGKPSDAGKPTDAGKPSDAGKPTDAGKPSSAGKPSGVGKPSSPGKPATPGSQGNGRASGSPA